MDSDQRLKDIQTFYLILDQIEEMIGGRYTFDNIGKSTNIPSRGIYFFFEPGESRSDSGNGDRVVRIGTHALNVKSQTTLWDRLRQHRGYIKGKYPEGGNHRGSIFRKHVGQALIEKNTFLKPFSENWAIGQSAPRKVCELEYPIEKEVSHYIKSMPFIWLEINDPPGPSSLRGYIEKNCIALLSNFGKNNIDPSGSNWLGHHSKNSFIIESGLWNVKYIDSEYDSNFLNKLITICNK